MKSYVVLFHSVKKSKPHSLHRVRDDGGVWQPLNCLQRMLYIAVNAELHIWPQLTQDNVQRSYLNFKEDE